MRQLWLAVFVAFVAAAHAAEGRKLKVLTSFLPVYCFTVNVAGDRAEVQNLLPPGASPHDFQLSPPDVRKFNGSDLLIANGLGAEPWLEKLVRQTGKQKQVVLMSTALEKGTNPHIWLDPALAARAVTNILRALQAADPANAEAYAANATTFVERLYALDRDFECALAPLKGTSIITYHDAFPHLARRYGLHIAAVVEETPEVPPGPRHLAKLRQIIQRESVKAMFTDAEHPQRLAEQLAVDFGVRIAALYTIENGPLSPGAYEDAMRKNLRVLTNTLSDHASANTK
ncbi:MAG TPA: zinc ABC transporter substrate-binding protein [Verrucomicrobiae bacterium]|nr:zinc ABC transporter substrate-binding protein [Verrucomicrobiae bacterium]